jgi:DNA-binding MarR family transcriptional regulator
MTSSGELRDTDFLLAQVCRLHHGRAHALLDQIGLYRGQPPLLDILYEHEGQKYTDLAARLGVAPATVTKMLQRMEKAGFVIRQADAEDQRVSRAYLTDAGRDIRSEMHSLLGRLAEETFAGFTTEERLVTRGLLERIKENLARATH